MSSGQKVSPAHERAFSAFEEKRGVERFRRQDVADALYPVTTPRSREAAGHLADVFIARRKAAGRLVKDGHVHWRLVVADGRTLKSGRMVPVLPQAMDLTLNTRCPLKWVAMDLETGEMWVGAADGWKRPDDIVRAEVSALAGGAAAK